MVPCSILLCLLRFSLPLHLVVGPVLSLGATVQPDRERSPRRVQQDEPSDTASLPATDPVIEDPDEAAEYLPATAHSSALYPDEAIASLLSKNDRRSLKRWFAKAGQDDTAWHKIQDFFAEKNIELYHFDMVMRDIVGSDYVPVFPEAIAPVSSLDDEVYTEERYEEYTTPAAPRDYDMIVRSLPYDWTEKDLLEGHLGSDCKDVISVMKSFLSATDLETFQSVFPGRWERYSTHQKYGLRHTEFFFIMPLQDEPVIERERVTKPRVK